MSSLRDVRKKLGVTKWKLALLSGLNWKTIHRIENGEHIPYEKTKEKIAKALGVPVEDVFPVKDVSHIFLIEPSKKEDIKLSESKANQIVGYLLDKNFRRCAGVGVSLMAGDKHILKTKSEADGKFHFEEIPEGVYQIVSKAAKQEIQI